MRVLVTDHVFDDLRVEEDLLSPLGAELVVAPSTDEATLAKHAAGARALLACYAPVTRRVVEAAASGGTRVIARYGIGYDNVDVTTASELGIVVTNVPDYCIEEVADHTLGLLLAMLRGIERGAQRVRAGQWAADFGEVRRIRGRRLALLGLGRIGTKTAERARPFGFDIVAYDPLVSSVPAGVRLVESIEDAVSDADVVSLHMPLTPANRGVVSDALIQSMRRAPVIVNTSRGELVDTGAVMRALDAGRLSGVALDVTAPEPLAPDHPLRTHPRALITPHMAFRSVEAEDELRHRAADEVVRALTGKPPRCPVRAEIG